MSKLAKTFINYEVTKSVPMIQGGVYVVGSFSGAGKSTVCANIALPLLQQGEKVLWVSSEHTEADTTMRMACLEVGLNFNDYLKGNMPEYKQREAMALFKRIKTGLIVRKYEADDFPSLMRWSIDMKHSCVLVDHVAPEDVKNIEKAISQLRKHKEDGSEEVPAVVLFINSTRRNKTTETFMSGVDCLNIDPDVVLEVVPNVINREVSIIIHKNNMGPHGYRINLRFVNGMYVPKHLTIDKTREKAIIILEKIAEMLGDEEIFDCKDGDDKRWYRFEDAVVEILGGKNE